MKVTITTDIVVVLLTVTPKIITPNVAGQWTTFLLCSQTFLLWITTDWSTILLKRTYCPMIWGENKFVYYFWRTPHSVNQAGNLLCFSQVFDFMPPNWRTVSGLCIIIALSAEVTETSWLICWSDMKQYPLLFQVENYNPRSYYTVHNCYLQ
jgi:hypothetical protein